jgi:hypothetical protein
MFQSERTVKTGRSTTATLVGAHRSGNNGRTSRSGAARGGETPRRLGAQGGLRKARAASGGARRGRLGRPAHGCVGGARRGTTRSHPNLSVCPCLTAFSSKIFN